MTGKEMCEKIAEELKLRTGKDVDPEKIWNASPTGDLFHVAELYWALFPDEAPPELQAVLSTPTEES
jgi:hypothetical protein